MKNFIKNGFYKGKQLITTCAKFKGLEARAVILVDVDKDLFFDETKWNYNKINITFENVMNWCEYRNEIIHGLMSKNIDKNLATLGFASEELSSRVMLNLDFARINMKANIYSQAVLEGVATTFPQTEEIIENGKVNGVTASDVQKILNLKHAWEFILDKDVIQCQSSYHVLCHIAKLVNEGFYADGGRIRGVPVTIGGTSYVPLMPIETIVIEHIDEIINSNNESIDNAISLCLYCMKTQIFNDGNKRAAVIYANHYLISKGEGFIAIPENDVPEFKRLLVNYYEDKDNGEIITFMKENCWKTF